MSAFQTLFSHVQPSSLTTGNHVIWLQNEVSLTPLPEFNSGTKCPAAQRKEPVCVGQPAKFWCCPAPCSEPKGLLMLWPHKGVPQAARGKKNLSKNKANSNVLVRGACSQHYTQHPREGSAKFRGHKIWWISGRPTEERRFPFKLRRPSHGQLAFPPLLHGTIHDGQTLSTNGVLAQDKYFSS